MLILCHGCFDLFHIGHLKYLEAAKSLGDRLIVTLTSDEFITKGPGRPLFKAEQRKQMLEALKIVDKVEIIDDSTAIPAILAYQPDIYAKGMDYLNSEDQTLELERQTVESYGGKLVILETERWSSTEIMTGETLKKAISKVR
jgi:rfaE bifunctional protein nucleotidyltransferase chain/domain